MKKKFIITIDTEGDNLWRVGNSKKSTDNITNKNGEYLIRFQELCEKYNFIPTYLTNFEMAKSTPFVQMSREKLKEKTIEIGMHLHAFNSPPYYELKDYSGGQKSYIGEYPLKIINKKVDYLTKTLEDTFQTRITSHRGGRWYFDEKYMKILMRHGYLVDCTVTPLLDWRKNKGQTKLSHGFDFRRFKDYAYRMSVDNIKEEGNGLWEVPVTTGMKPFKYNGELYDLKKLMFPDKLWLRPDGKNLKDLLYLVDLKRKGNADYIEFMLHSSELMPGGSPTFTNKSSIDRLYCDLDILFHKISDSYIGCGLTNYVLAEG